jgi:hypothetical protein
MDDGVDPCVDFAGSHGDALELVESAAEVLDQVRLFVLGVRFVDIVDTKTDRIRRGE